MLLILLTYGVSNTLFFYGLGGAIFRGFFPTINIISHLLSSVKVELMFGYFLYLILGCPLNFGSREANLIGRHLRSWELELRGAHAPPNPPTFYYIIRSCVLSSVFLKKYFFFLFIFPLLLYHISGAVVKYFLENFLKKFFKFFLTLTAKCSIIIIERKEKRKT